MFMKMFLWQLYLLRALQWVLEIIDILGEFQKPDVMGWPYRDTYTIQPN